MNHTNRYALVVEADSSIRELMAHLLDEFDLPVVAVPTGFAARAAVADQAPALAIVEDRLPDLNHDAVVRLIRELRASGASVIVCSAAPQAPEAARDGGADGYLPKPFEFADFEQLVGQLVAAS